MRRALVILAVLGLMGAGCKTLGTSAEPTAGGASTMAVPTVPPLQTIPDTGGVPTLPPSSHIIVELCTPTGGYVATGVDTRAQRFTFLVKGGRATQAEAFSRFYAARAPVVVYTSPVSVKGRARTTEPTPEKPPAAPIPAAAPTAVPPTENNNSGSGDDGTVDPCNLDIGDDPGGTKKPGGNEELPGIFDLAWNTSVALDRVIQRIELPTVPAQTGPR